MRRPRRPTSDVGAVKQSHPHLEELVLELLRFGASGALTGDARRALDVRASPANVAPKVLLADLPGTHGAEDALDALADVERFGLLLDLLDRVQGLVVAEPPTGLRLWVDVSLVECLP